jgi:hypothetical protein
MAVLVLVEQQAEARGGRSEQVYWSVSHSTGPFPFSREYGSAPSASAELADAET